MKGIKYLLDTDTFSFLVSGRYPGVRKRATLHKDALSISAVTVAEALYGARRGTIKGQTISICHVESRN